ncbi:class I glutamine amidotransferase-like protein [Gonapodya prolifera JEL478]|uniref:Class I glutamine amidotransferase-like protein n=1 Tax=Gonapodya prolifera (strain JEL478) TaxID=1344416 RepID=A0A139ASI9_GONPJ|nr:class I glutamine amidotransferase-like protein [Gonapodya prolifera JEL478]|eukprot:KXS19445.1 class I glutamine amidotransferase-like protein [Gonapodya prolifera JEL478]
MATNHVSICGILYEGWEALDLLGPLAVLHKAGSIAQRTGRGSATVFLAGQEQRIYSSPQGVASYPQKTFGEVDEVDVLVCPGGFSSVVEANNRTMLDFVKRVEPKAKMVTSVCSGAAIYAKAGILDAKTATTNKAFYDMLITYGPRTKWIHKARFVLDGKFATSSGVSAGIDMAFAVVEKLWGADVKNDTAKEVGYAPAGETEDPFAEIHGRISELSTDSVKYFSMTTGCLNRYKTRLWPTSPRRVSGLWLHCSYRQSSGLSAGRPARSARYTCRLLKG